MPDIVAYAIVAGVLLWNVAVVWWFARLVRDRVPTPPTLKVPPLRPGRIYR